VALGLGPWYSSLSGGSGGYNVAAKCALSIRQDTVEGAVMRAITAIAIIALSSLVWAQNPPAAPSGSAEEAGLYRVAHKRVNEVARCIDRRLRGED